MEVARVNPSMRSRFARQALAAALALLAGCGAGHGPSAEPSPAAPKRVTLVVVTRSKAPELLDVTGSLSAEESVVVSAEVAGRVSAMPVDLGSRVQKGQLVAQLDATDYALRVQQAEAALAAAKASLGIPPTSDASGVDEERTPDVITARATRDETARQRDRIATLVGKELVSSADLEAASATAERAEADLVRARQTVWTKLATLRQRKTELALAREALADTNVRAPISGTVSLRLASVGATVAPGSQLVSLVQVDPLRLRVSVPERLAGEVHPGLSVRVLGEAGRVLAEVPLARVAPILSEGTRSLEVEADVPLANGLTPGAFVHVAIVTEHPRERLTVPTSAIVVFAGLAKVLTVVDGKVRERAVELGAAQDGRTEITGGVDEGTPVVAEPGSLQNGDRVAPDGEEPHAEAR
jgi:HlyD family secretion protein